MPSPLRPVANPPNPWASTDVEYLDGLTPDANLDVIEDHSRSILSHNDSPDLGFRWSANPYRGCVHACAYCYARPTHEYLGFGAGTDFDRKIVVKPAAPVLLREAFDAPSWKGETVLFSGVTDCYQPLEACYHLTRSCLEVCTAYCNPACVITKSALIERDIDVLLALHAVAKLTVTISIPLWQEAKARAMEPFVTTPQRRVRIIERLARAGLNVGVNVAPVIPGLGDEDIPHVLEAAAGAGARSASYILLRLPGPVKDVFASSVEQAFPHRAKRILARIRETRDGGLNDARFGSRQRGEGVYAESIRALFDSTARRCGLAIGTSSVGAAPEPTTFRRPAGKQLPLF